MQVSDIFSGCNFNVFVDSLENGGIIKVLCLPSGAKKFTNTALKKGNIYDVAIKAGAKGLPFLKVLDNGTRTIICPICLNPLHAWLCDSFMLLSTKPLLPQNTGELEGIPALTSCLEPEDRAQLLKRCSAKAGDLILFAVGDHTMVNKTLDRLRLFAAHEMGLIDCVSL